MNRVFGILGLGLVACALIFGWRVTEGLLRAAELASAEASPTPHIGDAR